MLRVLLIATALLASHVSDIDTSSLVMNQGWVPYPTYDDRDGWAEQLGEYQERIAAAGEKYLGFRWVDITDDDYRAWDLRDDRHQMEDKYFANQEAIRNLFVAELAEGKGRYLPDIAAGVAWWCDLYSWSVVTHLAKLQTNRNPVPNPGEQIVELQSGNVSQMMAWLHYFLGAELDKIQPGLADRLKNAVKEKTMDTYMNRDDFWWMGFDTSSGKKLNNWNPWCNQNVLLCFMLLEDDREKLAQAVERTMRSVSLWLDSLPLDGCCDEGTTYWYKSTGHLLDYLENLGRITGGAVNLWNDGRFYRQRRHRRLLAGQFRRRDAVEEADFLLDIPLREGFRQPSDDGFRREQFPPLRRRSDGCQLDAVLPGDGGHHRVPRDEGASVAGGEADAFRVLSAD